MSALVAGPTPVRTLVYTCCDRAYEDFVALFAWAALAANPDCAVEVGVESAEAFFVENGAAADAVGARFGADRFVVHEVPFATSDGTRIRPNTVRFVTTPRIVTRYVYIADVDVIMLEPGLTEMHLENMRRHGSTYSNVVRPGTRRMSGLHFCERASHYPLPDLSDLDLQREIDEAVLYEVLVRRGVTPYEDPQRFRPVPGIHMSPNRTPLPYHDGRRKRPGWNIPPHVERFERFTADPGNAAFLGLLSDRVRANIAIVADVIGELAAQPPRV